MKKDIKMKDIVFLLFGIMVGAFIIAGMVIASDMKEMHEKGTFLERKVSDKQEEPLGDLNEIIINVSSTDVLMESIEGEAIRLELVGDVVVSDEKLIPDLTIEKDGKKLQVEVKSKNTVGFTYFTGDINLVVGIPRGFAGDLTLDGSSSDFDLKDLDLNTLYCDTSSGDVVLSDITVRDFIGRSSSGKINAKGFTGSIDATTTSGDMEMRLDELVGDIKMDASSGDVDLYLPKDSSFIIGATVSSGDIETEFPIIMEGKVSEKEIHGVHGEGQYAISVDTTSGDISIYSN